MGNDSSSFIIRMKDNPNLFLADFFKKQKINKKVGKYFIFVPEIFGFCDGVVTALKKLSLTLDEIKRGQKVYLLGEIIHNPTVNQHFLESGVQIIPTSAIKNISNIANPDDILVFPAFGIPLVYEKEIRKNFPNIIDTTCKNVKSVWEFISFQARRKSTIILHGRPGHPEVEASISRIIDKTAAIIIPDLKAAKKLAKHIQNNFLFLQKYKNISKNRTFEKDGIVYCNIKKINPNKFALANQTTMLYNDTIAIEEKLKQITTQKKINFSSCKTICNATYLRQQAAIKLCQKKPDIMLVIGGYDSSNTNQLYKLAKHHAITYYIKDSSAISNKKITYFVPEKNIEKQDPIARHFNSAKTIGILAGASCPFSVVNNVIKKLAQL